MKKPAKRLLIVVLGLSVPATLYAVSFTDLDVTGYQRIGSTNGFSTLTLGVGLNNVFSGSSYSAAIGTGLISYTNNSLIVGTYNKYGSLIGGSPLFVVGNGTGYSPNSQNALEVAWSGVLPDKGTVNIPGTANIGTVPSPGGLSMTGYTAP